jgi:cobyrinic acid a,c-diamide synthase
VVATAGGRAFTFRYAETEELLTAAGCEVVTFDPLADRTLPPGTQGIYLGGGFPEMYAAELAANTSLLHDLRAAVANGIPTVAECAGLLYLARSLDGEPMAGALATDTAMADRLTLRYPVATAVSDSLLTRAGDQVTGHEFHRTLATPAHGERAAWEIDSAAVGFASDTLHASYLHVHWAGHPQLAQRFADSVHAALPHQPSPSAMTFDADARERALFVDHDPESERVRDPLRHHGDAEVTDGLLDFAVNVYLGSRPPWLDRALHSAIDHAAAYPDDQPAREAIARLHGRPGDEVLPTAGAAEAFSLLGRMRAWRRPVVVHPQFTEPHAALEQAGHAVTSILCRPEDGFALDPASVPDDADLVIIGNPTNPTGVLHPKTVLRQLCRDGRLVVVDEAFMDAVPGEAHSLVRDRLDGVLVIRSLTKHWSIPGIRAGYVVGDASVVGRLAPLQTPWSVSGPAIAAMVACASTEASSEAHLRAETLGSWRDVLESGLGGRGIAYVASAAPYVLARVGDGVHAALRSRGVAVRRADTFPGLDGSWARIAVRPPSLTRQLFAALDAVRLPQPTP